MLTFTKNQLKALIPCSAKADIRYYLNGALLEVCSNGDIHLVSTDGHILFAGLIPAPYVQWTGQPQSGPFRMIIPRQTIETALKAKTNVIELVAMPDGRYTLGDTVFSPIEGTFPDWRRVIVKPLGSTIVPGQYDPNLVLRATESITEWFGIKKGKCATYLHQYGEGSAVLTSENMTGFCIIMPWRAQDADIKPFTPASYE